MNLTPKTKAALLGALEFTTTSCMRVPGGSSARVYNDNLSQRAVRFLWEQHFGPIPARHYLRRTCSTEECVNPHHQLLSKSTRDRGTHCPNGHPYTPGNMLASTSRLRCRTCHDERLARRRKGTKRAGYCKNGHRLTKSNSYCSTDKQGRIHRRCKTCTLAQRKKDRQ